MYSKTFSAMLLGINAKLIEVELYVSGGLPQFQIIGLASKAITEARQRVAVAMQSSGFEIPPKRVLVNLCPADMKKEGPQFDFAIAALLLKNLNYMKCSQEFFIQSCFLAELTLTGELKKVKGLLSLILDAVKLGMKNIFIAKDALRDLEILVKYPQLLKKTNLYLFENLKELSESLSSTKILESLSIKEFSKRYSFNQSKINSNDTLYTNLSFEDIIGQSQAKRAIEIAIAGGHNLLMIGPPGCGKSLLAKASRSIHPKLTVEKAIETLRVVEIAKSLSDKEKDILDVPYRAPHSSCSSVALVGGSVPISPGEVSLAHNGILFLDELAEFDRFTLDQLRVILDNKKVALNKGIYKIEYPADFILLAATNPCPCGYYGDLTKICTCSTKQIQKYFSKISGPLLDRIDLVVQLSRMNSDERALLTEQVEIKKEKSESKLRLERISKAKAFAKSNVLDSSLDMESKALLIETVEKFDLSARSHAKLIKLSRTIANLDFSKNIKLEHIAEAIQYREDFHH